MATAHAAAGTRELVIETREVTWELRPGTTIRGFGYNGRIPGPEIRV